MNRGLSVQCVRVFLLSCSLLFPLLFSVPSSAEEIPVFPARDANGVDVPTGAFVHTQTDVSIGPPGDGGLAYTRYYQGGSYGLSTSNQIGYVYVSGSTCKVVLGNVTHSFTSGAYCSSPFTSAEHDGSTLTYGASIYTYTNRDGIVARFQALDGYTSIVGMVQGASTKAYLTSVTKPDGESTSYSYEMETYCDIYFNCLTYGRLQTVYNNFGYRLWFSYPGSVLSLVQPNKVTAINNAVEYCVPGSCINSWPAATYTYYSGTNVATATNPLGKTTSYTYTGYGQMTKVQFPDNTSHNINIAYSSGRVYTINLGFGTWTYTYGDVSGTRTTTITNPGSSTRRYHSSLANGRILDFVNELSETTYYQYDTYNRLTRVTQAEWNYVQYTLDSRGNVIQVRQVAKPSSGPADIVTSAAYPSSCTYPSSCNKPTSTTDARGYRTDFTYNNTHGGLLTATAPAASGGTPVGSGDRPQTRFTYAQKNARYATSASTWVTGSAVWRLTAVSACASGTSASCINPANETRTTSFYPSSSTANNLEPISITVAAGDSSVSSTSSLMYTKLGDVDTVDGPLSADATRYYYDDLRQVIGVVGPDPDGGGSLLYRAVRTTFNEIGEPTSVERGRSPASSILRFPRSHPWRSRKRTTISMRGPFSRAKSTGPRQWH